MTSHPLISVLMPVYNVSEFLPACLESVSQQTYPNVEVVLVDDGSTDGSGALCDAYCAGRPQAKAAHIPHGGSSAARNAALDLASGDYIAFVDADDFVDPAYLETMYRQMEAYGVDISICGRYRYYADGRAVVEENPAFSGRVLSGVEALRAMNSFRSFDMSMWSKLIRRELFEGLRFPLGRLCEDYYLCPELLYRAQSVYYEYTPLYYYRQRQGSNSRGETVSLEAFIATDTQRALFEKEMPRELGVAQSACAFARIEAFSEYNRRGISCPDRLAESMQKTVRAYMPAVLGNDALPRVKKLQALCFALSLPLYSALYKRIGGRY